MTASGRRRAPAVERAVSILDWIAVSNRAIGVSEIARGLGLPKSSVFGICESLSESGLLRVERGGYTLGSHCLIWSAAFLGRSTLVQEFHRTLADDERLARYTVTLSILDGDRVTYLACRNSNLPLGFTFTVGMRLPAVYCATGKAMLATLPDDQRRDALSARWPIPYTGNGVVGRAQFEADMPAVRRQGFAVDDGEIREGMICVGAAVRPPEGRPLAGIAVSLTSAEATTEIRRQLGGVIAEIAATLSRAYS